MEITYDPNSNLDYAGTHYRGGMVHNAGRRKEDIPVMVKRDYNKTLLDWLEETVSDRINASCSDRTVSELLLTARRIELVLRAIVKREPDAVLRIANSQALERRRSIADEWDVDRYLVEANKVIDEAERVLNKLDGKEAAQ